MEIETLSTWPAVPLVLLLALGWAAGAGSLGCAGTDSLSESEQEKLDPVLLRLVQGQSVGDKLISASRQGETVYHVFLTVSDAESVREAGIPIGSVSGQVATGRLTVEDIRRAARLAAVTEIAPAPRNQPHDSGSS